MIGNAKPVRRFAPFPAYADRAGWDGIPQSKRQFLISAAKGLKGKEWASLPAIRYMDFFRDGNRSRFQALYFNRRTDLFALLLAECLEGKGEYIEDIINGVWLICEETS